MMLIKSKHLNDKISFMNPLSNVFGEASKPPSLCNVSSITGFVNLLKRKATESIESLNSDSQPRELKKARFTQIKVPPEIQAIGLSNSNGSNQKFFKILLEMFKKGEKIDLNAHFATLSKKHGEVNGSYIKMFIEGLFIDLSSNEAFSEIRMKKIINNFYVLSDLIENKEDFEFIKSKIKEKVTNPTYLEYLEKCIFEESAQKRWIVSIFNDPTLMSGDQLALDFDRQTLLVQHERKFNAQMNESDFRLLAASFFAKNPQQKLFTTQLLNFINQASKQYSLIKSYQHPALGYYRVSDSSFFVKKIGSALHFGYYQTFTNAVTNKALYHYMEYSFDLSKVATASNLLDLHTQSQEQFHEATLASIVALDEPSISRSAYLKDLIAHAKTGKTPLAMHALLMKHSEN